MKLLMITGLGSAKDLASGKKGAFYNTLEEFHKYWERIDIICPRITNYELRITSLFGNVFVHISPWPLIFHPVWFIKKAMEIYKKEKFNLMTVHEFPPFYNGIGARLLWQKIRVPYVMEIFHIPGHPKPADIKESVYKLLIKIFIRFDSAKASAIRVMNEEVGNFLAKAGVPKNKIVLIPAVYVDLEIFRPANLTKEYDLIFIGRWEANKGISLLLEAVNKLKIKNEKLKVLIVGDGSLKKDIQLQITNYKLPITMYGYAKDQKEIAELINKSKILVMPSYNEGGPRVVVEAMACGVPVLATPVGIVPDVLKDNLGGMFIDWQAGDIAEKAQNLLSNEAEYKKNSLAAQEIAKKYDKKSAIKNYYEAINHYSKSK